MTRSSYQRSLNWPLSHPWRRSGRPRACATDVDIGAVWDASEDQRGVRASDETKKLLAGGVEQVTARLIAWRSVSWEDDPWARGTYAFFDPSFPPSARRLLALPFRRVFFAGEHTSIKWQGYMNGAVESGLRAAHEILARMDLSDYVSMAE